jgi:hypothetical protein
VRESRSLSEDGSEQREMSVGKEELRCKRIEVGVQELLRGGYVDLAVFNAEVITVNQERRYGQAGNPKSGKALAGGLFEFCCPKNQINLLCDPVVGMQG